MPRPTRTKPIPVDHSAPQDRTFVDAILGHERAFSPNYGAEIHPDEMSAYERWWIAAGFHTRWAASLAIAHIAYGGGDEPPTAVVPDTRPVPWRKTYAERHAIYLIQRAYMFKKFLNDVANFGPRHLAVRLRDAHRALGSPAYENRDRMPLRLDGTPMMRD
jgi:hypothetical protein